jgi:hemerythrin-like domain-containing protein
MTGEIFPQRNASSKILPPDSPQNTPMSLQIGEKPLPTFQDPLALLSDCHRRIERFLRDLITVVEQARGGRLSPVQRDALETALRYFREAAPRHTQDEEESLFPRMRQASTPECREALDQLDRLETDHQNAAEGHAMVERLGRQWLDTGRLSLSETGWLGHVLNQLRAIYDRHIRIEDHEVFPIAGRVLRPFEIEEIGREMARRRGQQDPPAHPREDSRKPAEP